MGRRSPDIKTAVRRYHDRVAGKYDDIYGDAYWAWHDALTWDYLKPHLPRDTSLPVADLGCGTGKWGLRLLKSGFAVTFVDISGGMIERARRKAHQMNQAARAAFVQADLEDLGTLRGAGFALAVALGEPLASTRNPGRAVRQIRGILRPGGVFIATFDNRLHAIEYYLDKGDPDELAAFLKSGRTQWLTRDREERFELWTCHPRQARALLEQAGFEIRSVHGKTILPMRKYRHLLEDPARARRLLTIEKRLAREREAVARAPHIQIAARLGG
jgi:SAM-dependent methyltransferase